MYSFGTSSCLGRNSGQKAQTFFPKCNPKQALNIGNAASRMMLSPFDPRYEIIQEKQAKKQSFSLFSSHACALRDEMGASRLKKLIEAEENRQKQQAQLIKTQQKQLAKQQRKEEKQAQHRITAEENAKRKREESQREFLDFYRQTRELAAKTQQQQNKFMSPSPMLLAAPPPPEKKQRLSDIRSSIENQSVRLSSPPEKKGAEKMFISSPSNPTKIQRLNVTAPPPVPSAEVPLPGTGAAAAAKQLPTSLKPPAPHTAPSSTASLKKMTTSVAATAAAAPPTAPKTTPVKAPPQSKSKTTTAATTSTSSKSKPTKMDICPK